MEEKPRGIPIVISSPSGGGKTSIYNALAERHAEFFYSISATTRPRRANEADGVQYHFLDEKEFLRRREAGEFIETARVHDHWYGTPREPLERALREGRDAVLDVDVQGGDSIRGIYGGDALLIFIVPPDLATLRERLEHRRSEEPALVERRMTNALDELRRAPDYDYIVVNDVLRRAVYEVEAVITAEHLRSARLAGILGKRFPELGEG
ncbi:MAG: guanylate kinase [bacterium]|nr:guanylate kinase [bacterium]